MPEPAGRALAVAGLCCAYAHGAPVLEGVDLQVGAGEVVSVLGASGCGKTTLLRAIGGFVTPSAGTIALGRTVVARDGRDLVPAERRRLGIVFQDYALFAHMTVERNVAFGLAGGPDATERAGRLLDLVGLRPLAARHPAELSGGQQQRVALARALAPDPTLLLLDEPFANLDAALRLELRDELREVLRATGTSALLVTHNRTEALSTADCVAVLGAPGPGPGSRVLQCDVPEVVYRRPADRAVAALTGRAQFVAGEGARDEPVARTPLGHVLLLEPRPGPIDVLVRPAMLRFSAADAGAWTVASRQFLGRCVHLRVEGPAGSLGVEVRPEQAPPPGARGELSVAERCWSLSRAPGPAA